ncbi:MAG: Zn-dependent protease with chaperone function [Pirellula sp.]|nr:Zn-dependent protease with chaperone function [Pirellula sp.]
MDFFQHQDDARRKSGRLIFLFAGAVVAIVAAVYLVVAGVLLLAGDSGDGRPIDLQTLWNPALLAAVAVCVGTTILAGSLYRTATLSGGGKNVAETLGGRLLASATHDWRERRLLNVVEEMALASGVPVPAVYILESETEINAFAAGFTTTDAVIGVTRGAVNSLTRDELQGVIAHEFSHILNGDMRLNIRLIGLLHGILLLSMIGYVVMRMLMETRPRSSSSSSSDNKKNDGGGILLAIFLIGLGLYVIGYIGVFFGHLIKSAVSRQREYLADASAVQYTRNPGGIGGALKKLGAVGSRIKNSQAEQASHMYFGNGMKASFLSLLATHPPLIDRVRRIEPTFDGDFSAERLPWPSPDEESKAAESKTAKPGAGGVFPFPVLGNMGRGPIGAVVGAAALAGEASATNGPQVTAAQAVADVGAPKLRHFDYAAALIDQLPESLADAIHKPPGAAGVIYALLLEADPTDDEPGLQMLARSLGRETSERVRELIAQTTALGPAARLPLAQLAMSALRQLSPGEFEQFRQTVVALIRADRKVSLFEYCLQRIIFKHLVAFFRPSRPVNVCHNELASVAMPLRVVLSALARVGNADQESQASQAFTAGAAKLGLNGAFALLDVEQTGYSALDDALVELAASAGSVKQQVLMACAETIGNDGRLTIDEAELLRTVSDALDCPMPPPAADLVVA